MKILFYENRHSSPIKKFINKLSPSEKARFLEVYEEIEEFGLSAVRIKFKHLEGKLWEIKFRTGFSSYRIIYVLIERDLMIWIHIFGKKSQKTPSLNWLWPGPD